MAGLGSVNNAIMITAPLGKKFFRIWIEFFTPIHHLTDREKDVAACFIKYRYLLRSSISDEEILDKMVMSEDIKAKVKAECNVSNAFFQVIMGKLRKSKFLIDNRINPKFIPKDINKDSKACKLLLYFDLNE